ncbi:MAG: hypothetical protein F4162_06855 [Synechococcus sp. SB0676_bin_10]|uniref:Tc1-like transposase DDE domain-containing protein n=1 Tax=Synechococcus sp. SB0676_bin_10 TaxID=2604869 RepID=A0A6B1FA96_9SYNE|nr:hypothetical protein [Synechococcus sp. SB0664_bin_36]MYG38676.1 hypothetical protein [Synechococcus sp. SB0676_bin_10]MYK07905.1 hypothetical protein [Synechococcus sp. SB0670_bin_20]
MEGNVPSHLDSHLIVDNYCTHQRGKGKEWLGQRLRFPLHLTPTYGPWIKQVERCCGSRSQNPMDVVPAPALESSSARSIMTLWSPATPQPVPLSGWLRRSSLAKIQRLCTFSRILHWKGF